MSDPIDMAEGATQLYNSGAVPSTLRRDLRGGVGRPEACRGCDELPIVRHLGGKTLLACPRCASQTGPHSSRQRMIEEWNRFQK